MEKAGKGNATIHDLRRSAITNWGREGLAIHIVQQVAGHRSIATTSRYYLKMTPDDFERVRQAIEDSFRRIG